MMGLQELIIGDLERYEKDRETWMLYLYTPMCGTCQMAGRMLSVTLEVLPGIECRQANLNYFPDLAGKWSVESVPCLLFFREGKLAERIYAFHSVPYLLEKIKEYLL
ncbi:thioredoxin family protein [Bacillus infantis]|uniref:thioredoxin family protein n=1 Tax=Bacillus infantis TaxID=324767 RepID=UPI0021550BD9|nr:thioredoxin family protein [Bacillus infantis]MCR6612600.1 thioredoxin family protein [Bacillus infantis]